jgi:shikimate kinase
MPEDLFQKNNIYLMGFMGCGKSKIGELLAERLNKPYLDTDEVIIKESGMSIPEIFEKEGEIGFRKIEKACITRISALQDYIISLGGGAILDPANWNNVSRSGITITLSYPPEILISRLAENTDRPLLDNTDYDERLERITELLNKRDPYYKRADLTLHLNKEVPANHVAEALVGFIKGAS